MDLGKTGSTREVVETRINIYQINRMWTPLSECVESMLVTGEMMYA